MKRLQAVTLFKLSALGFFSSVALGYPTIYPTGTTIYYPDLAYSSYILISDHSDRGNHPSAAVRSRSEVPGDVRLIDMNGNVVHTWQVEPYLNKRSRLLPNGNLLYAGPNNLEWQLLPNEDRE